MNAVLGDIVILLLISAPATAQTVPVETYRAASVDNNGNLRITTTDRRTIVVKKQGEETTFRNVAISKDRTAVGALADHPNCCTSYDIPLRLVVYADGKVHRFKGSELPIFEWHFADAGTRVAYRQEPVHFGCGIHYELRDIRSERLIESFGLPQPCGSQPDQPQPKNIPAWVTALNRAVDGSRLPKP